MLKIEERLSEDEIYSLAKTIPLPVIKTLSERNMIPIQRLDFLLELAEVLGLGGISVPGFDQNNATHEVIINNVNPNKVTCNHTRGYLSTIFSDGLGKTFECNETECVSHGGSACHFVLSVRG